MCVHDICCLYIHIHIFRERKKRGIAQEARRPDGVTYQGLEGITEAESQELSDLYNAMDWALLLPAQAMAVQVALPKSGDNQS